MSQVLNSFIAISSDFEAFTLEIEQEYKESRKLFFLKDSFLVADARAVIAEAYIAEAKQKIIVLGGKSVNLVAQNALLKILEEPPHNIVFIFCVPSKTTLLPTIRSRLPVKVFQTEHQDIKSGLVFEKLNLQDVYTFVNEHKNLSKQEAFKMIEAIGKEAMRSKVVLKEEDLSLFGTLLQLANLNTRPQILLTTQLLTILNRVRP